MAGRSGERVISADSAEMFAHPQRTSLTQRDANRSFSPR
jgi:hypothetical protein